MDPDISDLLGKTMVRVERTDVDGEDALVMETDGGMVYTFAHRRNCCESVTIEDIAGDLSDLVGSPLTMAEESSQDGKEAGLAFPNEYTPESSTWTFYKFATLKGYVDVRFFGESNGYYSEASTCRWSGRRSKYLASRRGHPRRRRIASLCRRAASLTGRWRGCSR